MYILSRLSVLPNELPAWFPITGNTRSLVWKRGAPLTKSYLKILFKSYFGGISSILPRLHGDLAMQIALECVPRGVAHGSVPAAIGHVSHLEDDTFVRL